MKKDFALDEFADALTSSDDEDAPLSSSATETDEADKLAGALTLLFQRKMRPSLPPEKIPPKSNEKDEKELNGYTKKLSPLVAAMQKTCSV